MYLKYIFFKTYFIAIVMNYKFIFSNGKYHTTLNQETKYI